MFFPIYFMLFAVVATLPALKDKELTFPLTAEDLKDIDRVIVNITVVARENSNITKPRQDDEDITDIASENGGLKLATHIVNLLLGGFGGIGNALANQGSGMGGEGTPAGGAAGGTATGTGGAAGARPRPV